MADCDDPTLAERLSLELLWVGCAVMEFLRNMRRLGATTTAVLVFLLGSVTVAKENDWPEASWWSKGSWGQTVFIALYLLSAAGTLFVVLAFRRLITRKNSEVQFATAAKAVARLVEKQTSLRHDEIGVNVWVIKGMKGFRRLFRIREAMVVAEPRAETPITWTKGKGIIGQAWARDRSRFGDLQRVRKLFPPSKRFAQRRWCALERDRRFRLSWEEFCRTSRYHAVLAVPLRRHRFGRHRVRGVLAIDVLVPDKGRELDGLQETAEFSSILRTCQAAFAGDESQRGA